MAFKFIVKDEDLPKPTILAVIHLASIILFLPLCILLENNSIIVVFVISEVIQVIYLCVFYKKIVSERYSNIKLRTVTISFIISNVSIAILCLFDYKIAFRLTLIQLILIVISVFTISLPLISYLRKIELSSRIKIKFSSLKDFSFPYYKITAIIPMYLILPAIFIKSKVYTSICIILLALGYIYAALGEYYNTKKKDELDRLIKYEASFIAMQFLPALIIPLFFLETFYKIQIPWFYCMVAFSLIHLIVQILINKRYE